MKEFFENMDPTQRIYWYVAIGASLLFVLQMVISLVGGGDSDIDADVDTDADLGASESPFHLFSLKTLTFFLLGVGWAGVLFYGQLTPLALGVLSIVVGCVFVFVFYLIIKTFFKMVEDNSFKIGETIGKTGDVYLNIPAQKTGKGKVLISVKGSVHELEAITPDKEPIKSGTTIKVLDIDGSNLIVTTILN
ncbi:membrane protein implicated in regulation of membrane protease activity [Dysgonomonas sp. PH5-45]|uniref:NfeD family protein n=1 Tax=unclassified Dysgonomonas TaxID=2630389 RepID=UPI002474912C|nr:MULTISPECIES: NfeD family protein [unclassified Dysgonomonas]MDH6355264.1 membrane protein implicated in regulation of membrane protease activity [Dysgonomonas sp. PH5-45]MDH6388114.1 membrane protein implicated in regulation of membrane protease activity [Dysgonomonas sp. PH5-37]